MKIGGIIAEYNPFHYGHAYQLNQLRQLGATHIVIAMSGNFVQRGGPAVFSKWARAEAAVRCGADLVVELPTPCAMTPAGDFALAGVSALERLGVELLCFGSEHDDISALRQAAQACSDVEQLPDFPVLLRQGCSHPVARELLLRQYYGKKLSQLAASPNNLLGMEYLRAIKRLGASMEVCCIQRTGVEHHSSIPSGQFASASYLRELLFRNETKQALQLMPEPAAKIAASQLEQHKGPCQERPLDLLLLERLRCTPLEELSQIQDVAEGLEHRMKQAGFQCSGFSSCEDFLSGKRYTRARIRRILWNTVLGIHRNEFPKVPEYLRILAMNQKGKEILRIQKEKGLEQPAFSAASLLRSGSRMMKLETLATERYSLCSPKPQPGGRECREGIRIVESSITK